MIRGINQYDASDSDESITMSDRPYWQLLSEGNGRISGRKMRRSWDEGLKIAQKLFTGPERTYVEPANRAQM